MSILIHRPTESPTEFPTVSPTEAPTTFDYLPVLVVLNTVQVYGGANCLCQCSQFILCEYYVMCVQEVSGITAEEFKSDPISYVVFSNAIAISIV